MISKLTHWKSFWKESWLFANIDFQSINSNVFKERLFYRNITSLEFFHLTDHPSITEWDIKIKLWEAISYVGIIFVVFCWLLMDNVACQYSMNNDHDVVIIYSFYYIFIFFFFTDYCFRSKGIVFLAQCVHLIGDKFFEYIWTSYINSKTRRQILWPSILIDGNE